jgi:hypothetical protein
MLPAMRHREHPSPDLLLRFLREEASGTERREVVIHLLTGCPECLSVTRPFWQLAESFGAGQDEDSEPRRLRRSRRRPEALPRTAACLRAEPS